MWSMGNKFTSKRPSPSRSREETASVVKDVQTVPHFGMAQKAKLIVMSSLYSSSEAATEQITPKTEMRSTVSNFAWSIPSILSSTHLQAPCLSEGEEKLGQGRKRNIKKNKKKKKIPLISLSQKKI